MARSDSSSSGLGSSFVVPSDDDRDLVDITPSNEEKVGPDDASSSQESATNDDGAGISSSSSPLAAAIAAIGVAAWAYERRLQRSLTRPPMVYNQMDGCPRMIRIHDRMKPLLDQPIVPSLVIGTRGLVSSVAAYLQPGPKRRLEDHPDQHHFRQYLTMAADGATVSIDWELPIESHRAEHHNPDLPYDTKESILSGPISRPVILIWHGINNDSSFGYIRSLKRTFCNRGWNAAGVNFRGCGGTPLSTPRGYTAGHTSDLRQVVWHMAAKMMTGGARPKKTLFLVGNSLGANLVTKYLGEEGYAGTLPPCVGGGVALGNPLKIHSDTIPWITGVAMGLGVKKTLLQHYQEFKRMTEPNFQSILRKAIWRTGTVGNMDRLVSQIMIRNSPVPPYRPEVGYHGDDRPHKKSEKRTALSSGEMYWHDSSSYPLLKSISIPFLHMTASDDFLVGKPSRNKIGYLLSANPNVMVVETACGGHLGWHEECQDSVLGSSWADRAAADFFAAALDTSTEDDTGDETSKQPEFRSRL